MKIVPHSAPSPEDKPAETKPVRAETPAPPLSVASQAPAVSLPAEPHESKPILPETRPADVETLAGRFEMDLKKQIAAMHRALAQDIDELNRHQQKGEEKEGRQVQTALDHIQENFAVEAKALEQKREAERLHWAEQLKQREAVIEKLTREMSALKKAVETPPVPAPAVIPVEPTPKSVVVPPVAVGFAPIPAVVAIPVVPEVKPQDITPKPTPLLSDESEPFTPERGVLARIWDYLNGTAIEIPLKSRDKE